MTYPGGKGRAYQRLINLMPPHDVFIETHLGGGAVMLKKRRAARNIGIDADDRVIARWRERGDPMIELVLGDAASYLVEHPPGPAAMVFCDPPYWPESRRRARCYRCDYTAADHARLLAVLVELRCKVIITGYPSPAYDAALPGWHAVDYVNCTQMGAVTERAWTNFAPPTVLHDYDHLGIDFREREALRRRRTSHVRKLQRAPALERNAILADLVDAFPDELKQAVGRRAP
ncbi:DNA adenine methylase [Glacieibacterium frigidum]|uniref:site-specific DNA-methyltransferase (adenine-specific) n=1 Tax=Glacieibacterium frigidum TaxID=2593303 RepID=A0A552U8G4_9SPHN|nr:DNA adenine methylase [Glacieibacterium frigidum]TRW14501.1 DNA adenine methylase [Glacieibacterium frigidum]